MARNVSDEARAAVSAWRTAGVPVVVPSIILAETLHGDQRDARADHVLKNLGIVPTTEQMARVAATLKPQSGRRGVRATIDALVVATSVFLGGVAILTSDPEDIDRLAAATRTSGSRRFWSNGGLTASSSGMVASDSIIDDESDSRALYYRGELRGQAGNWVDGTAPHETGQTQKDENPRLAKVWVAGSNPVFRTKALLVVEARTCSPC